MRFIRWDWHPVWSRANADNRHIERQTVQRIRFGHDAVYFFSFTTHQPRREPREATRNESEWRSARLTE